MPLNRTGTLNRVIRVRKTILHTKHVKFTHVSNWKNLLSISLFDLMDEIMYAISLKKELPEPF